MRSKFFKVIRETWFFWLFFLCLGFKSGREADSAQMSSRAEIMVGLTFAFLVAFWVSVDSRRRDRAMGYGFPALVFFAWPIFGPLYLFQTRGVRGFLSLLGFAGLFIVAAGVGTFVGVFISL